MRRALSAIHVNHGISPNAAAWEAFCERLCAAWDVPLVVRRVSVGGTRGTGLEAAARAARYREFATVDASCIVVAHHRDDQAETVLLNLLRGGGVRALAGMPLLRPLSTAGPLLLRPLLDVPRRELEAYARDHGLSWIEDESNRDTRLRRNFVRHCVLPLVEEHFPACRDALARGAKWAAEAGLLLDELAAADAAACIDGEAKLRLSTYRRLGPERSKNLLRHWLRSAGLRMPDSERLATLQAQLGAARSGQRVRIDLGDRAIRCYRDQASIEPRDLPRFPAQVQWNGETSVGWVDGKVMLLPGVGEGLSLHALACGPVSLRTRCGAERMQLDPRRPRRTLKNLLQEAGVPPWLRPDKPLLWCGDDLVWVPGVGIAWQYRCAAGEPGISPSWEH